MLNRSIYCNIFSSPATGSEHRAECWITDMLAESIVFKAKHGLAWGVKYWTRRILACSTSSSSSLDDWITPYSHIFWVRPGSIKVSTVILCFLRSICCVLLEHLVFGDCCWEKHAAWFSLDYASQDVALQMSEPNINLFFKTVSPHACNISSMLFPTCAQQIAECKSWVTSTDCLVAQGRWDPVGVRSR